MMNSSAMMAGSTMQFEFGEHRGKAVGSKIRLFGSILGIQLEVPEDVTDRDPLRRKQWETIDEPPLLVIGRRLACRRVPQQQCGWKTSPQFGRALARRPRRGSNFRAVEFEQRQPSSRSRDKELSLVHGPAEWSIFAASGDRFISMLCRGAGTGRLDGRADGGSKCFNRQSRSWTPTGPWQSRL